MNTVVPLKVRQKVKINNLPDEHSLKWQTVYHRGEIDLLLIEDLLTQLESTISTLDDDNDWTVVFYLIYSQEDQDIFNLWEVQWELKKKLADFFVLEMEKHFGNLEKSKLLETALEQWNYNLVLPDEKKPFQCSLKKDDKNSLSYVDIDIILTPTPDGLISKGYFLRYVRVLPLINKDESLLAKVILEGEISIGYHIDLSQHYVRGRQQQILLTKKFNALLVGPHKNCDLIVKSIKNFTWLIYDGLNLYLSERGKKIVPLEKNSWKENNFHAQLLTTENLQLNNISKFELLIKKQTQKHNFYFDVIARVLPKSVEDGGFGKDWCKLSEQLNSPIIVSIPLTSNSIIAIDKSYRLIIWDNSQTSKIREEEIDNHVHFQIGNRSYEWKPNTNKKDPFYGFLYFGQSPHKSTILVDQPAKYIVARATGFISGVKVVPSDYLDDDLVSKQGSITIDSDGNGNFLFNVTDVSNNLSLYLYKNSDWQPSKELNISLDPYAPNGSLGIVFASSLYKICNTGAKAYKSFLHWSEKTQELIQVS